ncbi:MAG: hypothetical protein Kow0042_14740 [Calditrichia bacterium]
MRLAKRVRRDLSNKRIRKFISEQIEKPSKYSSSRFHFNFKNPVVYLILIIILLFLLVRLFGWSMVENFYSSLSSQPSLVQQAERVQEDAENAPQKNPAGTDSLQEVRKRTQPVPQRIQIEVLNGCGVDGVASTATRYCRSNNLDVVYMGNYENFNVENSMVIGWTEDKETPGEIARLLGIDQKFVSTRIDRNKQLAASVVLGKDYKKLKPFAN